MFIQNSCHLATEQTLCAPPRTEWCLWDRHKSPGYKGRCVLEIRVKGNIERATDVGVFYECYFSNPIRDGVSVSHPVFHCNWKVDCCCIVQKRIWNLMEQCWLLICAIRGFGNYVVLVSKATGQLYHLGQKELQSLTKSVTWFRVSKKVYTTRVKQHRLVRRNTYHILAQFPVWETLEKYLC